MALIKCPECCNEVSDKATSCPKCGYPLLQMRSPQVEVKESKPKEQQYDFTVDMSSIDPKILDNFLAPYSNALTLIYDDGEMRTYKARNNQSRYVFTELLKKEIPKIRIADAVQYVERLVPDNTIVVARRRRTDVVAKFIGWMVGLTIC